MKRTRRGPRDRHETGGRSISPSHLARLRAIVARAGSINGARTLLGTGIHVLEDALTFGRFRAFTVTRLEEAIDRVAAGGSS